jgi:hypothetical protein
MSDPLTIDGLPAEWNEERARLEAAMDAVKAALPKGIACVVAMAVRDNPEARAFWANCSKGPVFALLDAARDAVERAPEPALVGQG